MTNLAEFLENGRGNVDVGVYEVIIKDVQRKSRRDMSGEQFIVIEFEDHDSQGIPALYINDRPNSGDIGKDRKTKNKAYDTVKVLMKSARVDPHDIEANGSEADGDDPLLDALKYLEGRDVTVSVRPNTVGTLVTVPTA